MKTKIKNAISLQRLIAVAALLILVLLGISHPLDAQTLTQGYGTDGPIQKGMIVRIKDGDESKVVPLSLEEADKMHGVVVDSNDAAVTLSADNEKVFVATTGKYEVLVSNQNGEVNEGDWITISAIHGVGMKASTGDSYVMGKALETFDGSNKVAGVTKLKDSSGGERDVRMGRIRADITVARNPLYKGEEPNLPGYLRKISEQIAGKPVDATRVYLGLIVMLVTTAVAGSLLYGGVRSGIISIGRNPLSKKSVIRGMVQVIIVGLIIFILGLFGVYLLLKL
jgi:hypothetical protein